MQGTFFGHEILYFFYKNLCFRGSMRKLCKTAILDGHPTFLMFLTIHSAPIKILHRADPRVFAIDSEFEDFLVIEADFAVCVIGDYLL
jgi:hypothetical protein